MVEEVVKCHGNLLSFCLFKTKNHHDAQDLVSETVIRIFNSYDKGTSNYKVGTNILGYLKLIALNLYRDKKRKEKRSPNVISLHRKIDGEEHMPNLNHLPYMSWFDWIKTLNNFKYEKCIKILVYKEII